MKTLLLTFLALIAFAGNSVLCRLALYEDEIDATSFTVLRLLSGAIVLWLLLIFNRTSFSLSSFNFSSLKLSPSNISLFSIAPLNAWAAPLALFIYAAFFSFAYELLNTGVGALFLFGAVQMTMIGVAIYQGKRLSWQEWAGVVLAFMGLVYLILPSLSVSEVTKGISLSGSILMIVAGIAWGWYSLLGRGSANPLADTANNFVKALPFVIVLLGAFLVVTPQLSLNGVLLALASGGITSGLGYAIWYSALKGLSSVQAAVVQLFVPVIAALGGLLFAGEIITLHVFISGIMVIVGVLWVTFAGQRKTA